MTNVKLLLPAKSIQQVTSDHIDATKMSATVDAQRANKARRANNSKRHFAANVDTAVISSPVGALGLSACGDSLTELTFLGGQAAVDASQADQFNSPILQTVSDYLAAYWLGNAQPLNFQLDLSQGTEFQQQVWLELLKIPFGQTISYRRVADSLGRPAAVRAVANAIGRNPIGIIIPCHRVIGSNGSLTGFAGGLECKSQLLRHEGAGWLL